MEEVTKINWAMKEIVGIFFLFCFVMGLVFGAENDKRSELWSDRVCFFEKNLFIWHCGILKNI